jgi:hypothetical protein
VKAADGQVKQTYGGGYHSRFGATAAAWHGLRLSPFGYSRVHD